MISIDLRTNLPSLMVQSNLAKTTQAMNSSLEKLASGKKINSAADGAADLAVATKMSAQLSGSTVAEENVQQGMLLLEQSDGSLQEINSNLTKIRDLAVKAANGTYSTDELAMMKQEAQGYLDSINSIAKNTKYNDIKLLDGSVSEMKIQTGANTGEVLDISSALVNAQGSALGTGITSAKLDTAFASSTAANSFIADVDSAIKEVSSDLSTVGNFTNSLNSSLDSLSVKKLNLEASEATLMDVDYASELSNYVKLQVQQEAQVSLLAQANQQSALALKLLQ